MNHLKTYLKLIRKAESRNWRKTTAPEYVESHHVFPKCIWPNSSRTVYLTAREHFLAHALLAKVAYTRWGAKDKRTWALVTAYSQMGGCKLVARIGSMSSHLVADGRKMFREVHSLRHSGENNPAFGFQWWTDGTSNYFGPASGTPTAWRRGKTVSKSQINDYRWYTNGLKEIKVLQNQLVPSDFHPGRLSQSGRKKRETLKWITDGVSTRKIPKDCPIPIGWKPGRLK